MSPFISHISLSLSLYCLISLFFIDISAFNAAFCEFLWAIPHCHLFSFSPGLLKIQGQTTPDANEMDTTVF